MNKIFSAFRSGFGFLTTIPVGIREEGIENLMKHIYLFPLVGAILGVLMGILGYASSMIFQPPLTAVVIIIAIYYLTGINHVDGLADLGDGIVSHGTRDEKIRAMKDTALGTGGLLFITTATLGLFASLILLVENTSIFLPYALIVAEISSKQSMVTVAAFGKRLHEGFGAVTVDNAKLSDFLVGMVFSGLVCYFLLGMAGIKALLISQLGGLLVLNTANRHFGGVSGDVIGASNEVGRLAALVVLGGILWMPY